MLIHYHHVKWQCLTKILQMVFICPFELAFQVYFCFNRCWMCFLGACTSDFVQCVAGMNWCFTEMNNSGACINNLCTETIKRFYTSGTCAHIILAWKSVLLPVKKQGRVKVLLVYQPARVIYWSAFSIICQINEWLPLLLSLLFFYCENRCVTDSVITTSSSFSSFSSTYYLPPSCIQYSSWDLSPL